MCRKCYPIINTTHAAKERWHEACRISEQTCLMCRNGEEGLRFATLYVHRICPEAPEGRYEELERIPDRLRWLRKSRGLLQSEVAERIGITRAVYLDIESGQTRHIPAEAADALAAFYGVPVSHFTDGYDKFLREGQGRQIRAFRGRFGMNKKQFARHLGIPISSLRAWESGKKTISRRCWEQYFQNIRKDPGD